MSDLIISISGIRGIVGESLTPEVVERYCAAFAAFCGKGNIVVGYDGRPSGRLYSHIVEVAIQLSGCNVIDIGLAPTPTVQMAVEYFRANGGIAITASHNPAEWNGLKFLDATGVFLDQTQFDALHRIASAAPSYARWDALGSNTEAKNFGQRHIEAALSIPFIDYEAIRSRRFNIVVDAVNASGSYVVPELLRALGCEVIPIACDGSGEFPHTPEPIPTNLSSLGDAVRDHRADFGIAVDPDADRLVLYMENGEPFGEEYSITTAVYAALKSIPDASGKNVVVNLSTTRAVEDVAKMFGAVLHRTPVGEINVVKKMRELQALIGGEGSGGIILPSVHYGRDSLVGCVLVLSAFAGFDGSISAFRKSLPDYSMEKRKFSVNGIDTKRLFEIIRNATPDAIMNCDDGLRFEFPDGWVHLRASNTEPIMRIIAEARTPEQAQAFVQEMELILNASK